MHRTLWAAWTVLSCALIVVPLLAFQYFGYSEFCGSTKLLHRPWCSSMVPYIYGYVQRHYWNVGLLRYFELKQVRRTFPKHMFPMRLPCGTRFPK